MSNPTPTPKDLLVGLINSANTHQWQAAQLVLGNPTFTTGEFNTTITAEAIEGLPYTGHVVFSYNRLALSTMVGAHGTVLERDNAWVEVADIIDAMVELYGVLLTPADLVLHELAPPDENGIILVILMAAPTSLIWTGTLQLNLVPPGVELEEIIPNNELNGFDPGSLNN